MTADPNFKATIFGKKHDLRQDSFDDDDEPSSSDTDPNNHDLYSSS